LPANGSTSNTSTANPAIRRRRRASTRQLDQAARCVDQPCRLIPEFVGRLPVLGTLEDLDEPTLKRILVEPKEIVRTLKVSRATVRKVLRGHKTEFKYSREVRPTPKLGSWVEVLTEIIEMESKLPKRERRSTRRLFEELRGRGYDGAHDSVHRFVKAWRDERTQSGFMPMCR
jgi:hypothetical protein